MRGSDFFSALDHLQQLDRSFKNSDLKSRWDALRPQIEAGSKTEINKKVVFMSYRVASDLVQKKLFTKLRIDEKGNPRVRLSPCASPTDSRSGANRSPARGWRPHSAP